MKIRSLGSKLGAGTLAVIGIAMAASCSNQVPAQQAAPAAQPSEIGRFQIVVTSEADRGSVLFLVDTKEGATWIYRPPQGTAINGFWSDIPRLTYAPDFWQRAFSQQQGPSGQLAPQPESAGGLTPPTP